MALQARSDEILGCRLHQGKPCLKPNSPAFVPQLYSHHRSLEHLQTHFLAVLMVRSPLFPFRTTCSNTPSCCIIRDDPSVEAEVYHSTT